MKLAVAEIPQGRYKVFQNALISNNLLRVFLNKMITFLT
jgi:hypothetical protein